MDSPLWPEDAAGGIPEREYGQRLLSCTFRNSVLSRPEDVALTFDFFGELGDRHNVLGVFVCDGHEDDVIFTRFEPDYLYDTGYRAPVSDQLAQYFNLGVKHIFLGYDHIAFLLAVILWGRRLWPLVKVVTAFTVAHSLTLSLAVLDIMRLPSSTVEPLIAATIVYVAAENFFVRDIGKRWRDNINAWRRLTLLPRAQVVSLRVSGNRVTEIELLVNDQQQFLRPPLLSADCTLVLAASTIESTRLALDSLPGDETTQAR